MISHERPFRNDGPHHGGHQPAPRPPVQEETIHVEKIQIERKTIVVALKENPRGRFLRITEDVGGRRDTVIIPSTGLEEFLRVIEDMIDADYDRDAELNPPVAGDEPPTDPAPPAP